MRVRRHEDEHACAVLGATCQHIPLVDGQYRDEIAYVDGTIEETLAVVLETLRPSLVLAPLGIVHSDHVAVGAAVDALAGSRRIDAPLVRYEEIPYRVDRPEEAVHRLDRLEVEWYAPETCPDDEAAAATKARAVAHYSSQVWAIPRWTLYVPERLWLVSPAEAWDPVEAEAYDDSRWAE